jgi:hypothetical protein
VTVACIVGLGSPSAVQRFFALVFVLVASPVLADVASEPIRFARGASSATVEGAVVRGDRALYTIEARQGQRMIVRIFALEKNAAFELYEPDARFEERDSILEVSGQALPGAGEGDDATRWSGTLPRSGTYLVVVGGTRGNASYRLTVEIR